MNNPPPHSDGETQSIPHASAMAGVSANPATLRGSDELFRAVWESASDAMSLSDEEGTVVLANPAYYRLYGYSPDQVIGQSFAIIFPTELRRWAMQAYQAVFADPTIPDAFQSIIRTASGAQRAVETRINFVSQNGQRLLMLSTIRDVTPRVNMETERARILVSEQAARADAENAVRMRDELLSVVSHDLKNPLTIIKMATEALRRQAALTGNLEPERLGQALGRIDQAANRMNSMIAELLDLARAQGSQPLALNRQPGDLVALAGQVMADYQNSPSHQVRLQTTVSELIGNWDMVRLQRVFGNLLSNAVKYSPEGGQVLVSVACQDGDERTSWAVVTVQDQGIGIPTADLPHVFDWFYRAGNAPAQTGGTGIGLASARQIIEQHGGTIAVTSQEGSGATFIVRIPRTETPNAAD